MYIGLGHVLSVVGQSGDIAFLQEGRWVMSLFVWGGLGRYDVIRVLGPFGSIHQTMSTMVAGIELG